MSLGLELVRVYAAALFLSLWVIMGWNDYKQQKIRGHYLAYGAWGIAAAYAVLVAMTLAGIMNWIGVFPYWGYYQAALGNLFLCAAAALLMWFLGVWPAGDAKLFMLLAALYPLLRLPQATDYRRLFLVALINTFIPACAMLFLRAARHAFATRLSHRHGFLVQLGWKKEFDFFTQSLRESASRLWARRSEAAAYLKRVAADPVETLKTPALWMLSMLAMSIFSYYLKSFFDSPILFTLFWAGVFFIWRRFASALGSGISRAIIVTLVVALLLAKPPAHWSELWRILASLTFFSAFFLLGFNWTMSVVTGSPGTAYVLTFLIPFLGIGLGMAWSWLMRGVVVFGGYQTHTLLVLSLMGLFFGLSLVLVRLWDQEVLPSHLSQVSSYIVLAPSFIDRLREDPEFFEENFSRMYADGLTGEQAAALREWCAREGVDRISLTPTISFASWIFLGFFLALVLNGAHVLQLLL